VSWSVATTLLAAVLGLLALSGRRDGSGAGPRRRSALLALRACVVVAAAVLASGAVGQRAAVKGARVVILRQSEAAGERARAGAAVLEEADRLGAAPGAVPHALATLPARDGGGADVESGLRASLARMDAGADNRILVLADGEEGAGRALDAVPDILAAGARVYAVDLSRLPAPEVRLLSLRAPRRALPGVPFEVRASLAWSGAASLALDLALERDGAPAAVERLELDGDGRREVVFTQQVGASPETVFRASLAGGRVPAGGGPRALSAAVETERLPPVTYLTREPAEAAGLVRLLATASVPVRVLSPEAWAPPAGGEGGVIVVDNLSAADLGTGLMARIEERVRRDGDGLLAIGGTGGLGLGRIRDTPLEAALPAAMGAPAGASGQRLGLVIVLDASMSMFFRGRGEGVIHAGGKPRKFDVARLAIIEIMKALRPGDELGVIESRDRLFWLQPLGPLADAPGVEAKLMALRPYGGGINFYSSVREAGLALEHAKLPVRLIMVVCDANDVDQRRVEQEGDSADLVRRLAAQGMALSVFAVGYPSDKDVPFLRGMTALGNGEFYLVTNLESLPRYMRTEYAKGAGDFLRAEVFQPLVRDYDPLLNGVRLAALPPVAAVNLTTAKRGATEVLVSPFGAPLLAHWRYGRGRAAVFAADSGAAWARGWVQWPDAARFWQQLLLALRPRPERQTEAARAASNPARGRLELLVPAPDGLAPERGYARALLEGLGEPRPLALLRTGVETYEAALPAGAGAGTPLRVRIPQGEAGPAFEATVEEPQASGEGRALRGGRMLEELAAATGGAVVRSASPAFAAPRAAARRRPDVVLILLAAGILAVFGELVLRR
jgi:hypothetical protein